MSEFWNALSSISTAISAICSCCAFPLLTLGLGFTWWQLRELRRSNAAQAFWPVIQNLQSDQVRDARRILILIEESDFTKWTDEQKRKAEIACTTYDILGIFLKRTQVDLHFVTSEWRDSIIKCWEKALPMTKAYRSVRGNDYWNDFQWLYEIAKSKKHG